MTATGPDETNARKIPLLPRAIAAFVAIGAILLAFLYPAEAFLWVKAIHVIAVISWMAGMLYLPRLFVYHCAAKAGSAQSETFKVMERRLLRAIIDPAMGVAWLAGLWLAWQSAAYMDGWFHVKFLAVLTMSGIHGYFAKAVRLFGEDRNEKTARSWRLMNEVPTVLMVIIVIMVIIKPF
ncbi:protoporphyrinogen oxidase HemJ [Phyllobacterium brassicacearum]|uniref:Protoporphyrinogen IX oxidase n=1 Tax=Phyllobacterium brassicacearum TaxID=314235 RepID=A0A2P7BBH5_9HYPH|nr:protoporphyrinogen oxidase HemJ [Phyllobacterium brassicacearum]PSH63828.1 protoporphyrinogen oxidase HemJ [Phyllobacterium brassicacearum]TDQ20107.1 putative membrane protein [Phyllobacterium brassicacearum]